MRSNVILPTLRVDSEETYWMFFLFMLSGKGRACPNENFVFSIEHIYINKDISYKSKYTDSTFEFTLFR